jgi:hypothetical protein
VGLRAGLDVVMKIEILSYRESNPDRLGRGVVTDSRIRAPQLLWKLTSRSIHSIVKFRK